MSQYRAGITVEHNCMIYAFPYAFIVNLMPPAECTKVLDKEPITLRDAFKYIEKAHKALSEEKCPLWSTQSVPVHAVQTATNSHFAILEARIKAFEKALLPG